MNALSDRNFTVAIKELDEAIRIDPRDTMAHTMRANTYQLRGGQTGSNEDLDKAIAGWTEACELAPDKALEYRHQRARAYRQKCDYPKAIEEWTELIRLYPDIGRGKYWLADLFATCPDPLYRNGKKAVEYAKSLCEGSKGECTDYLEVLASAYAETGDFGNAVLCQKKFLETAKIDDESAAKAKSRLVLYEANKPYRAEK